MPVQVNEMVIRASVGDNSDNKQVMNSPRSSGEKDEQRDTLIAECVEQVLDILRREQVR